MPSPKPDAGLVAVASRCPGGQTPSASGLRDADLTRSISAGEAELSALLCNPLMPTSDGLIFYVSIVDHFGIPKSEVESRSWAEANSGRRTQSRFVWSGGDLNAEDHHVEGLLTGPVTAADGGVLVEADTRSLKLHLVGVGDLGDVTFEWGEEFLR